MEEDQGQGGGRTWEGGGELTKGRIHCVFRVVQEHMRDNLHAKCLLVTHIFIK